MRTAEYYNSKKEGKFQHIIFFFYAFSLEDGCCQMQRGKKIENYGKEVNSLQKEKKKKAVENNHLQDYMTS